MIKKSVIINRAVPGSGKTTITNCVIKYLKTNNLTVAIHSTDEYFMVGNKYIFNIEKLGEYHERTMEDYKLSLEREIDVIICDNTNIIPWQTEPYTKLAREFGYQIIIVTLDPRELEKHKASQVVTEEKPDAHGVREEILIRMIEEYKLYDDLLNPNIVINKDKHNHYKWNNDTNEKVIIGTAKHFDSDFVIRIFPEDYRIVQNKIGNEIDYLVRGDNTAI